MLASVICLNLLLVCESFQSLPLRHLKFKIQPVFQESPDAKDGAESGDNGQQLPSIINSKDYKSDAPGDDGPAMAARLAIQEKIQARVSELKEEEKKEMWGDNTDIQALGRDPLRNQALVQTMGQQARKIKPFESIGDIFATYSLVLVTTVALSAYLLALRYGLDEVIKWFVKSDFDALTSLLNSFRS